MMGEYGNAAGEAHDEQLVAWRRELHRYPGPGFGEFYAADMVARYLRRIGFTVRIGSEAMDSSAILHYDAQRVDEAYRAAVAVGIDQVTARRMRDGGTAVVADLCGRPGPLVGLRFDMDGLPIREAESAEHPPAKWRFRSEIPGLMHACGHDGHVAIGLGVASVLAAAASRLNGGIRLIFQPAEEGTPGGAASIRDRGLVDDVDYMICSHLGLGVPTGEVVCRANFLATSKYRAEFCGRGAHVTNSPQDGRNALLAACSAALAIHAIAPHSEGWFSANVGVLSGGDEQGITPSWSSMQLGFWAENSEVHDYIDGEVSRILRGSATAWGVESKATLVGRGPTAPQNADLASLLGECAEAVPGVTSVVDTIGCKAGEDANIFLAEVAAHGGQGIYVVIGSDLRGGHHTPDFDFDERSLGIGRSVLASTCLSLLGASMGDCGT